MQPMPLPPDDQLLIELNTTVATAESQRNASFLDQVLATDVRVRRANALVVDKANYLVDLTNGGNTLEHNIPEDIVPRVLGNRAVVTLLVRAKGTRTTGPFEGEYRNVRIFLKDPKKDPSWQLHFSLSAKVENP